MLAKTFLDHHYFVSSPEITKTGLLGIAMSAGDNCMEKRPKLISKLDAYKKQNGNNFLGYFCNAEKSSLS